MCDVRQTCSCDAARKSYGKFRREEKCKGVATTTRKPRDWVPTSVEPNETGGIVTRFKLAQMAEYEQQRDNDDAIPEILASFQEEDDELYPHLTAPESHHTVDSMETCTVNLWDQVFRDDAWKTIIPIRKSTGFGATHPGGTQEKSVTPAPLGMPAHFVGMYTQWSAAQSR